MNDIQGLADRIAQEFHPQTIVLFGSHAHGAAGPDSDVDLLIVLPHQGKSWMMATQIRSRVRPQFPVDLLVRSPDQLRDRLALGDTFLRDILRRGRVLYEADHR